MAYSDAARQYAHDMLQQRRLESAAETEQRRASVFDQIPALSALDQEIVQAGVFGARALLSDGDTDALRLDLDSRIDQLQQRQRAMLAQHGLPENALEPVSVCPVCKDSGYEPGGTTCRCVKQLMQRYSADQINRVSPLELSDFDSFSLRYYTDAVDDEYGTSPRAMMRENLEECIAFAARFPEHCGSLLFLGDAGLGKTHLALAIANDVIGRGYEVVYCSAVNVFRQIEQEQFNQNRDTTTLDSLKRCDLLILDDLGAEHTTALVNAVLYDILNTRMIRALPTISTSNITQERVLTARYGEKISSRLLGCGKVLPFFGDDIRLIKNTGE